MHKLEIPKKNGSFRTIYAPNRNEKIALKALCPELELKARKMDTKNISHAFSKKKNVVTNATPHIGHSVTMSFDLKDFFDSVSAVKAARFIDIEKYKICFVEGAARQGLPTSPAIANICASVIDKAILNFIDKKAKQIIYTRYADDLTFSFDDESYIETLKKTIPEIVNRCGFVVNKAKTHVQHSAQGFRNVCGISVADNELKPTREVKRKLRAALHQKNEASAKGLAEWCKLKTPKTRANSSETDLTEIAALKKAWRFSLDVENLDGKTQSELKMTEKCKVTSDLIYIIGASSFTNGWTSCVNWTAKGQYRYTTLLFAKIKGTSIAVNLSKKTMSIAGVERQQMAARCWVHELENGQKVYDRFYGGPEAIEELRIELEKNGYIAIAKAEKGKKVLGQVMTTQKIYLDNLEPSKVKDGKGWILKT